jgi:hypothetical protein
MSDNLRDSQSVARHHVEHVAQMLDTVISHVQGDLKKMADARAVTLFESALDVLTKLKTGFDEFDSRWGAPANPEAQTRPTDAPLPEPREPIHATQVHKASGVPQSPPAEAMQARAAPASPEVSGFDA